MLKLNALIVGSTGYIGVQLIKLLVKHKNVKIKYLCGNGKFIQLERLFYTHSPQLMHLKLMQCLILHYYLRQLDMPL